MAKHVSGQLPGGAVLAKGEAVRGYGEFLISNIFVFPDLKLKLAVTNKRLTGQRPNTIFGMFAVGSQKMSYPLSNIAGVQTSTRILFGPLLLGLVLVVVGIGQGFQRGWWVLLLGALLVLYCYRAQLNIQNSGGGVISHRIAVWNKGAAQTFAQEINTVIAERNE